MNGRDLLLRCYPRAWREEYGEEFAAILAQKRVTAGLVLDVMRSALWQRVRLEDPWKIFALGLAFWTSMGIALKSWAGGIAYWFAVPVFAVPLAVGYQTVRRGRTSLLRAAGLAMRAFVFGCLPDVVVHCITGPTLVRFAGAIRYDWGLYRNTNLDLTRWGYVWMTVQSMALFGFVLGILGGLAGALADGFRKGLRPVR